VDSFRSAGCRTSSSPTRRTGRCRSTCSTCGTTTGSRWRHERDDDDELRTLTDKELRSLRDMMRCYHTNLGRMATIEDIADHWYEMTFGVVVPEHADEAGRHHPAKRVIEVDHPHDRQPLQFDLDLNPVPVP